MGKEKAKVKNAKSNLKTRSAVKKQSNPGDTSTFSAQLAALGLRIVHVTADGNCFFRAIADQLEGNEEEHAKYRKMVVEYIMNHREDYEPFVEDDVPFEKYCESMQEDGTWAGHMELQAASLVTQRNICIHRLASHRWHIRNFDRVGTCTLHLSYHAEEHYNSVRLRNDDCTGPAKPIVIEEDNLLLPSCSAKEKLKNSKEPSVNGLYDQESVKLVLAGTGSTDVNRVHDLLQEMHGDTDAAIEFLIAEQNATMSAVQDTVQSCEERDSNGVDREQPVQRLPNVNEALKTISVDEQASLSEGEQDKHEKTKATDNCQKASRNKPCPCGSKKKHKACCGTGRHKSSAKITSQEVLTNKSRKMKLRNSKSESQSSSLCSPATLELPDLGALYI